MTNIFDSIKRPQKFINMDENVIQKFREKFMEEAYMLLDKFEKDILELEKDNENNELHQSVFRAMHTIKGISAMYGFEFISEFTHHLENIFQNIRDGKTTFNKEVSEISLISIDHIRNLLTDEKMKSQELTQTHQKLLEQIQQLSNFNPAEKQEPVIKAETKSEKLQTWYIIISTNEKMSFRGIRLANICAELGSLGEMKINRIPVLNDEENDTWGIILVTAVTKDQIFEAIMFIEDDCSLLKVADFDVFNSGGDIIAKQVYEPSILDLIENKEHLNLSATSPVQDKETDKLNPTPQSVKRISVNTIKLDNLMHLVSQLITLNTQLGEASRNNDYEKQRDYLEVLESLTKQFRDNTLEIRLVPLSDIALRFQRLIRDLSKSLEKKIEFIADGIDNELDKNTIDALVEPIMHLIRNCIDHGIEEPTIRKMAGKPETGTIRLSAHNSGNYLYITISDDGNGIDLEKVRNKAIEKGIITNGDKATDRQLYDFIFLPGFSTAKSLTEVSGRGVGMDIVKRRLADLHGSVSIESKKGEGTDFTIKIRQSMAITDTLLFKVENDFFILPVAEINVCEQIDAALLETLKHKSTLPYQNELIPFVDLRKILKIQGTYKEQVKSIVVNNGKKHLAILADSIIGEHQAVLKPLNKTYDTQTFIPSVSQLGNGKIAFLIDPGELFKQISNEKVLL